MNERDMKLQLKRVIDGRVVPVLAVADCVGRGEPMKA